MKSIVLLGVVSWVLPLSTGVGVNIPEVLVYADLDAHASPLRAVHVRFFVDAPAISAELFPGLDDHVPH